jgi:alkylation response protein AidB-like acyl-CoA dehydrogenase
MTLHALAEIMEVSRIGRLTRYQHVLLRLGELVAFAECAASMARRAARFAERKINEKSNCRFDATAISALARIFAREAALKVVEEGLRLVVGAGGVSETEMAGFESRLNVSAVHRAQIGQFADMDYIADVLFDRVQKAAAASA